MSKKKPKCSVCFEGSFKTIKDKYNREIGKYGIEHVMSKAKKSPVFQELLAFVEKQSQKNKRSRKTVNG